MAATTVGSYALFAGGHDASTDHKTVYAYNTSLTKTTVTDLSQKRSDLSATTVGGYALFAGGYYGSSDTYTNIVDAYDASLSRTSAPGLNTFLAFMAATTVGNYALFAGGRNTRSTSSVCPYVNSYTPSLTWAINHELTQGKSELAGATAGEYAIFAGGFISSTMVSSSVDSWDESLTYYSSILTVGTGGLVQGRARLAATNLGNRAIFGPGYNHADSTYGKRTDTYLYV